MRIHLADDHRSRRGHKRGLRRRRSWTFDTAMTVPRNRVDRPSRKRSRAAQEGQAQPSRRRRAQRPALPQADAPVRAMPSIQWRSVVGRLLALLALAALCGVVAYGSSDAKFFVYQAHIVGARHLPAEIIYQAAGVHEQSIFWIDAQQVARRVVDLVGIKAARVRCELPARVTIEVEEREPVVMWRATAQQQDLWLDGEGVVLPYHGDVKSPTMIFVVDYGDHDLQVGDHIDPEGIVSSVLQLANSVPGVHVFSYQPDQGLSFTQEVGGAAWPVYVGNSEGLPLKIQVVQALTGYLQANGIRPRYIDVRWPDHPVYGTALEGTAGGGN